VTTPGPLLYINEKLSDALHILATGPGDVRSRLITACPKILFLSGSSLPEKLKEELDWIQKKLTEKNEGPHGYDKFRTLRRMNNSTGSKIASKILNLQCEVDSLIEEYKQK
jgi:hypothetical protein